MYPRRATVTSIRQMFRKEGRHSVDKLDRSTRVQKLRQPCGVVITGPLWPSSSSLSLPLRRRTTPPPALKPLRDPFAYFIAMASLYGSFTSQEGSVTQASPWGAASPHGGPPAGYFAPMSLHYEPFSPHARYPAYQQVPGSQRGGPLLAAPPPQLLPHHSYLIEDPVDDRGMLGGRELGLRPKAAQNLSAALVAVSILGLISQLVATGVALVRDHDHVAPTAFWLCTLSGGVSCVIALGSLLGGGCCEVLSRFGFLLSLIGSSAAGAFWFYVEKEGAGVLLFGHAILAVTAMLMGGGFYKQKSWGFKAKDEFSFGQPLLGQGYDLQIGQ